MQKLFLPIVFVFCAVGLIIPETFTWAKHYIPYLLGIIMFGMGATLSTREFIDVSKKWRPILVGVSSHYLVMPLIGFLLATIFQLPKEYFLGVLLVSTCPAGTASNIMSYIAKGNVALSVTMTLVSTAISPILTPAIFFLMAQKIIHVDLWAMVSDIFWIIVFPIIDGLIIRRLFQVTVNKLVPYLPGFSLFVLALLIAVIISLNQKNILQFPFLIMLVVVLHNLAGFFVGYCIGNAFKLEEKDKRSISIEVGMQNSALGSALALCHLTVQSALPSAIFSLWQNIAGSILAKHWQQKNSFLL